MATGCVDYFRNALAAVGRWSTYNNTKYPPAVPSKDGSPRWSFDVSTDHADAILSHLSQRGEIDPETGFSHTVAVAWRALALLETEEIAKGATPGLAVVRAVPFSPADFPALQASADTHENKFAALSGGPDTVPLHEGDEQ